MTGPRRAPTPRRSNDVLPIWVHIVVVLVVLALLAWTVVVIGPEGYPLSLGLGALLGLYKGAIERLGRRDDDNDDNNTPTPVA